MREIFSDKALEYVPDASDELDDVESFTEDATKYTADLWAELVEELSQTVGLEC